MKLNKNHMSTLGHHRNVQQSTISAHELTYELSRILSIFRRKFYFISMWKLYKREWNSVVIICSKCCRSSFFKKYNRLRLFTRNWFKIKFPEITFIDQRTEFCFEVYDKTMENLR